MPVFSNLRRILRRFKLTNIFQSKMMLNIFLHHVILLLSFQKSRLNWNQNLTPTTESDKAIKR